MQFLDTRDGPSVSLHQAIACGLAPSGGLYVPAALPVLNMAEAHHAQTLAEVAEFALAPFFAGDLLAPHLADICREALTLETPLKALMVEHSYVLELFHGPTAAFKDFGARFLAACLARLPAGQAGSQETTILVATSGDTGAAVAAAFHQREKVRVVVLHPAGRVSARQAHQLGCFGDNIHSLQVAGSFDDCQRLVKFALNDDELRSQLTLSSANSISLGRLLPQMSYYAWAALTHQRARQQPLNVVIPTGNLGNALAAVMARRMGFPVGKIVFATNANAVLERFFAGDDYQPQTSVATLANAMDVGAPSNFERLRWWYENDLELQNAFHAQAVSDAEIEQIIRQGEDRYGQVWCPHTATAVNVLEQLRAQSGDWDADWAVVATAHPAKFETIVEPLIGRALPVPQALAAMLQRPAQHLAMAADEPTFKQFLMQQSYRAVV
ncbi:MAG: threonine synthase [Xanthomonadales bacterium]|nr:threonine synthase [Xanthomonadales bacterium]